MNLSDSILPNITFGELESNIQIKDLIDIWEISKQRNRM